MSRWKQGEKGSKPRIAGGYQKLPKARKHSLLEPEKEPALSMLSFYPVNLIADLWLPEL